MKKSKERRKEPRRTVHVVVEPRRLCHGYINFNLEANSSLNLNNQTKTRILVLIEAPKIRHLSQIYSLGVNEIKLESVTLIAQAKPSFAEWKHGQLAISRRDLSLSLFSNESPSSQLVLSCRSNIKMVEILTTSPLDCLATDNNLLSSRISEGMVGLPPTLIFTKLLGCVGRWSFFIWFCSVIVVIMSFCPC